MVRVVLQAGVVDPADLWVVLEVLGHRGGVVADAVQPQRQRLDALQDLEGIEGRQRRTGVAQRHDAGAANVGRRAQGLGVDDAVVAGVGLIQALEAVLVLGPGEFAGVDDGAADAGAVAAEVFGQRVHDDVGAVLDRPAQVGRGHGVVDDQRHAMGVGDGGDLLDVGHIALRVAERLDEDGLGLVVDQRGEAVGLAVVGELGADAVLRQRVREQVVGAAIERAGRDDVVARLGQGQDGIGDRRLARGHGQRTDAAFQRREALLQHIVGRVHDAAVDVAGHLQVEQVGAMLGAVEGIGHGLVDRHGDRLGGRVRRVAAVHRQGLEAPVVAGIGLGHGGLRGR
mmetsp:Transcript_5968/g.23715  ORF Transcript_5968/g.23715 Transcript_5968/m.23715 type:complete len:341 (+) Transcript_5968:5957-6979(+)